MLLPYEVSTEKLAREKEAHLVAHYVAKIMKTFGPAPIVKGENLEDFERILTELVRARCPGDFFIQLDVWDIAVEIWYDKRYNRASKQVLDRKIRENLDFQKQRPQHKLNQADDNAPRDDGGADDRSAEEKQKDELQNVIQGTPRQVETPLDQAAAEEANARAFEQAMPLLKDIDDLKTRSFFRRNVSRNRGKNVDRHISRRSPSFNAYWNLEIQAEDQRAWVAEFLAEDAAKKARTAKPPEQTDLPAVPPPELGNP